MSEKKTRHENPLSDVADSKRERMLFEKIISELDSLSVKTGSSPVHDPDASLPASPSPKFPCVGELLEQLSPEIALAYTAGLFDLGGNIETTARSVKVSIRGLSRAVGGWLSSRFGGKWYGNAEGFKGFWRICGVEAFEFIDKILPFLQMMDSDCLNALSRARERLAKNARGFDFTSPKPTSTKGDDEDE